MRLHSFISYILKLYKEDLADADRPNKTAPATEQAAFLQSFTENANFVFRYSPTANTIFHPILTSYVRNPLIMDDTELEIQVFNRHRRRRHRSFAMSQMV